MKKTSLFTVAFLVFTVFFVLNAHAEEDLVNQNALVAVMCNALDLITGGTGKTIATFAVIGLGIGFFLGKISWGLMLSIALGVAALFGAPTIVNAIAGGTFDCSTVERGVTE